MGVEVDLAANGKEAVEKVQQKKYQVILMDIQMPVMDGYEATRAIRSMEGMYYQHVPILALTASAMLGMRDRVMAAGMNDFIPKPFVPEELYAKIQDQVFRTKHTMATEVPIALDLDRYAHGDLTFKHKLSQLFVTNIEELQHQVERAVQGNDAGLFRQVLHKNKMTLQLVKNSEFALLIEQMNRLLALDLIPWTQLQNLEVEFKHWCMRITRAVLQP